MAKKPKYQLSLVTWVDSMFGENAWVDPDAAKRDGKKKCLLNTVGYIIDTNENNLVIAQSVNHESNSVGDKHIGNAFYIPIPCIVKKRNLS